MQNVPSASPVEYFILTILVWQTADTLERPVLLHHHKILQFFDFQAVWHL